MDCKIANIPEYLNKVQEICKKNEEEKTVFRGEQRIYGSATYPNLFRETYQFLRNVNPNFELNILNKIRSEGFDKTDSYLLTAIEAQHGGFPSRLLDITFNCLVALHFAVTPHMNEEITKHDESDGQVILIDVGRMESPVSQDLEILYSKMIQQTEDMYLTKVPIFAHEHFIVDYYRKNRRIEAQQGGFILFAGENFRPLPESILHHIIIDSKAKKEIRKELNDCFGINNAFIYPEVSNYPIKAIEFSRYYNNGCCFSKEDILENLKKKVVRNISYYCKKVSGDISMLANEIKPQEEEKYLRDSREMIRYIVGIKNDLIYSLNVAGTLIKSEEATQKLKDINTEILSQIQTEFSLINDLCENLYRRGLLKLKIEFDIPIWKED